MVRWIAPLSSICLGAAVVLAVTRPTLTPLIFASVIHGAVAVMFAIHAQPMRALWATIYVLAGTAALVVSVSYDPDGMMPLIVVSLTAAIVLGVRYWTRRGSARF